MGPITPTGSVPNRSQPKLSASACEELTNPQVASKFKNNKSNIFLNSSNSHHRLLVESKSQTYSKTNGKIQPNESIKHSKSIENSQIIFLKEDENNNGFCDYSNHKSQINSDRNSLVKNRIDQFCKNINSASTIKGQFVEA